jgi:hypothetical protein
MAMINFNKALADPSAVFGSPFRILSCPDLSVEEKIEILKQWEYDARELEVAEEENMQGGGPDVLHEILLALEQLSPHSEHEKSFPSKHGSHSERHH